MIETLLKDGILLVWLPLDDDDSPSSGQKPGCEGLGSVKELALSITAM